MKSPKIWNRAPLIWILSFVGLLSVKTGFCHGDTLQIAHGKRVTQVAEGEKVTVKTKDSKFKGQLYFLNDSTITVGTEAVELDELTWVRAPGATGRRIAGKVLTALGAIVTTGSGVGAVVIIRRRYVGFLDDAIAAVGSFIAGVVIITPGILLLRDKKYRTGKYTYSVH